MAVTGRSNRAARFREPPVGERGQRAASEIHPRAAAPNRE